MQGTSTSDRTSGGSDKVNLLLLLKPLWAKRKKVIFGLAISLILSVVLVLITQKTYKVQFSFIPQLSQADAQRGLNKGLSGLASLAGVNIGNQSNVDFPPTLYPKILDNIDFQLELLDAPLYYKQIDDTLTYRSYYDEYYRTDIWGVLSKYTIKLPAQIMKLVRPAKSEETKKFAGFKELTQPDYLKTLRLRDQISIETDDEAGVVNVSVTMSDKYLAVQLAKHLELELHESLIKFKTEKLKQELSYIRSQYQEKKVKFDSISHALADFKDSNSLLSSERSKIALQNIQSEYDLALSIYNDLARQLEEAKLNLAKNTPLMSVVRPISVPSDNDGPNSWGLLILFTFLGVLVTMYVVFRRDIAIEIKKLIN